MSIIPRWGQAVSLRLFVFGWLFVVVDYTYKNGRIEVGFMGRALHLGNSLMRCHRSSPICNKQAMSGHALCMTSTLAHSSIGSGSQTRQAFMKWGKKILNWMRRQTPESVPVYRCNYEMRATIGVAEACRKGMKLGV